MIYEMVDSSLLSLENQWRDLSVAFQRLAQTVPTGPLQNSIGNPAPNGVPRGLQADCEVERSAVNAGRQALQIPPRPLASALFAQAAVLFGDSDTERQRVAGIFGGLIGVPDSVEAGVCRTTLEQLSQFISNGLQEFEEVTSDEGQRFHVSGIRSSVDDIAAYPILTSGSEAIAPPSLPSSPFGSSPVSLKRVVDDAFRAVLGRLPKANDSRSFVAALGQSFQLEQIEGHVEFNWTPRSYAGQTELGGGVTGAQASLYTRSKVALDNALPLLDGLYPLLPDADEELVEAARMIVRSELKHVVDELGVEGGPRIPRVDDFFIALLDQPTTLDGGVIVPGGHLGYLRHVFGLTPDQVNTLEEEVNITNFISLQDYTLSIRTSWNSFRDQWFGRDLGTRLVLLSRALSVTAESVEEVYAAMDSVFVGSAERQVASFRTDDGRSVLVAELLSWINTFSIEEAPTLVHEGGRRGVEALVPTAQRLEVLVRRLIQSIPYDSTLPDGLRHPRVRHPLRELQTYLREVQRLAQDVRRP